MSYLSPIRGIRLNINVRRKLINTRSSWKILSTHQHSIPSVSTHQAMATSSYALLATPRAFSPSRPDNSYKQRLQLAWIKPSPVNQACEVNIRAEEGIRFDGQANQAPRKRFSVQAKAAESTPRKQNSIVCADCDGNGMVLCSQCKGSGVNSVDHFNGQFKAGGTCWLCRGKREMLCGNCNGAGFSGGFMSTQDE